MLRLELQVSPKYANWAGEALQPLDKRFSSRVCAMAKTHPSLNVVRAVARQSK
jgi:hypothetical protein